jgi:hypothetical protein
MFAIVSPLPLIYRTNNLRRSAAVTTLPIVKRLPVPNFHRLGNRSKSIHRGSECLGRLLFSVVYQDPITNLDTFIANVDPPGSLRRIRDECVYMVLSFTAKRTSEDFILVALAEHDPSMARERRKSRSAKVLLIKLTFTVAAEHRKMLRLEAKRSLAFGHHFSQIELRRWLAPYLARFPPP